ncbi:MAG: acyl--CoA ligase [Chitinophagaceae bacterium]|nr:acyl--CoA ligase [Chitinophagaceae bacterium]
MKNIEEAKIWLPSVAQRRDHLNKLFPVWTAKTLADHFFHQCEFYSDRPLLMMPGKVATYGEIWKRAQKIAKSFLHLGVRRGDHIAVLMANDPDFVALWISISMVGGIIVPLNTQLKGEELEYMIRQSDSNWLILHQQAGKQNHALTIKNIFEKIKTEEGHQLRQVICISNAQEVIPESFLSWDDFVNEGEKVSEVTLHKHWMQAKDPHQTAAIIYTSGSTGQPKGVMLTHDMMLRSGFATCLSRAYEDGRRVFAPLPLYHVYFVEEGLFAVSFVGGAMITSLGFSPLQSLELMKQYRANDFLAVPSMLISVLNQKETHPVNLDSLNALLCCAAPSPVPLWKRAVKELGVSEIGTGCGATEASSTTMLTEIGDSLEVVSSRVGKVKFAGVAGQEGFGKYSVRYKTVDPETGEDLPEGSVGELAVIGNVVSHGYYKKPEETAHAHTKDGWLRSGDLGRIDEQGYIQLLGRSKNIYKVLGEMVAPKEVEDVISLHPGVAQAYIVGVSDRLTTEAGAAFIELKEGIVCTKEEIRKWCQERVARFKVPRHVWFVHSDEWPLTATGKIQKFKLREIAGKKLS